MRDAATSPTPFLNAGGARITSEENVAHHLRLAKAEARPIRPGGFVSTGIADNVLRSLKLIRWMDGPAMTAICGIPGAGKTQAIKEHCNEEGNGALYHQVAPGEGEPFGVACAISRLFGVDPNGTALPAIREELAKYIGSSRLLVLDEAQHLSRKGLEWVRTLAEVGRFDVAFCGDLALHAEIRKIPQLLSRLQRVVVISEIGRAEVAAMSEGTAFANDRCTDALHALARLPGGLRNVVNAMRRAELFAEGEHATPEHLRAAIEDLQLAPKGGRS